MKNIKIRERFQEFIDGIDKLETKDSFSDEFKSWKKGLDFFIDLNFGDKPRIIQEYEQILFAPKIHNLNLTAEIYQNYYRRGLEEVERIISIGY